MRANPEWLPPAWQIARQQAQMAREVVPDDDVGFLVPPNQVQRIETDDYAATRVAGPRGFPNRAPWPEQVDIVFLGDSMLLGEGVGVAAGFVSLIDSELASASVINLGNPGAGLERQQRIFRRFGAPLQPELVVACLLLAYDLDNDTHFFAWLEDPLGMDYNAYRLGYAGRNETRSAYHPARRLERHPLYSWTQAVVEPHLWGERRVVHRVDVADGSTLFLDRTKAPFAARSFSGAEVEFDRLAAGLERLESVVREAEGRLLVVLLPSKEEIYMGRSTDDGASAAGTARGLLRDRGIETLDLYPVLLESRADEAAYYQRDLHFNATGNRIVADAFVSWFAEATPSP